MVRPEDRVRSVLACAMALAAAGPTCACDVSDVHLVPERQRVVKPDAAVEDQLAPPGDAGAEPDVTLPSPEGGEEVCLRSYGRKRRPVALLLSVHRSLSLGRPLGDTGETRWNAMSNGIAGFMGEPANADVFLGLQFYARGTSIIDWTSDCGPQAYSIPDVALQPISDNAPAIVGALSSHGVVEMPDLNTFMSEDPVHLGLSGAYDAMLAFKSRYPDADTAVILVDSVEVERPACEVTPEVTHAIVAGALEQKIRTFVLGIGDSFPEFDALAIVGGTERAYFTLGVETPDVATALAKINHAASGCSLALSDVPIPANRGALGVMYTRQTGTRVAVPQVADASACVDEGFYLEAASRPLNAYLCPKTCDVLLDEADTRFDVTIDCSSVTR